MFKKITNWISKVFDEATLKKETDPKDRWETIITHKPTVGQKLKAAFLAACLFSLCIVTIFAATFFVIYLLGVYSILVLIFLVIFGFAFAIIDGAVS